MWPYAASAAALSESHAATAVLIVSLSSALPATASNKLKTPRSAADPIIVAQERHDPVRLVWTTSVASTLGFAA